MAMKGSGARRDRTKVLAGLLDSQLARLGFADKVREHTAPLVWAEMVGPQVAAATEVDRVKDGVLYVSTRSATWAHELTFYKADILRRINDRVGAPHHPVITDIRFQNRGLRRKRDGENEKPPPLHPAPEELADVDLSPRELETIEEGITVIADEALRERVRRARRSEARLRTWRMDNGWGPCPECSNLAPPHFPYDGTVDCARCRITWNLGR
jgi:predicted nucleic acid-binding Zn ribbon protein